MRLQYKYSELSHKGNVRSQNEDSHIIKKTLNGELFIVCDGMGGAVGGKTASTIAVKSIVEYFDKEVHLNKRVALAKAIEFANEQIYATTLAKPELKGMGTTCCIVIINNNEIYYAHVGDSRIYLIANGEFYHLTKDHSFVMQLIDQGTITVEEAQTHRDKNRILKALGVQPSVVPSIVAEPIQLKKGDTVMICSDGLNDMVEDGFIFNILNTPKSDLDEKTHKLVELALTNGGKDNITVQTISITDSPYNKTVFIDQTIKPQETSSKGINPNVSENEKIDSYSSLLKYSVIVGVVLILTTVLFFLIPKGKDLISGVLKKNDQEKVENSSELDDVSETETELYEISKLDNDANTGGNEVMVLNQEKVEFNNVKNSKSVKSCSDFATSYPNSQFIDEVEELAWQRAEIQNIIGAYAVYYNNILFKKYRRESDDKAWKRALDLNNKNGYTKYVQTFKLHKTEAKSKISPILRKKEGLPEFVTINKNGENKNREFRNLHSILVYFEQYVKTWNLTEANLLKWNDLTDKNSIPDGTRIYLIPKKKESETKTKGDKTLDTINQSTNVEVQPNIENYIPVLITSIKKKSNASDILNCAFKYSKNKNVIPSNLDEKIDIFKSSESDFSSLPDSISNIITKSLLDGSLYLSSECRKLIKQ